MSQKAHLSTRVRVIGFLCGLVGAGVAVGVVFAREPETRQIMRKRASDFSWRPVAPGAPVLEAERWQGPGGAHCRFNKFPKNWSEPPHYHTNDIHVIVIEGKWGATTPGTPETLATPGSYQFIPGGLPHAGKCSPDGDCILYSCSPGPFDIKHVPPEPKK